MAKQSCNAVLTKVTSVLFASKATFGAQVNRIGMMVFNNSSAVLYIKLGTAAADANDYNFSVPAGGYYEAISTFHYPGTMILWWASANGFAHVTEFVST